MARASAPGSRTGTRSPLPAVVDDLAAPPDVGGDDRQPHGGRLHRRPGKALAVRGQHEHVHGGVERVDVVAVAEEPHAALARPGDDGGVERVGLVGVVAADDDERVAIGGKLGDRVEELGVALLRDQPSDRAHHDRVVGDTELGPGLLPLLRPRSGAGRTGRGRRRCRAAAAWRVRCSRCMSARSSGFWNSSASEHRAATASRPYTVARLGSGSSSVA